MSYYSEDELQKMGFKYLGKKVKISTKASIYDVARISIGDCSRIDDFCVISGALDIGKNVHITPQCLIAGGLKGIFIEDFCTFAYQVKIFSQSDDYSGLTMTNSTIPKKYKHEKIDCVIIKRHVIVGANSIIMPGVILAEGSSIGAMSLVLKSTEPWGIYYGIPAIRIKERDKGLLELEKEYLIEVDE
jgi:acetyltransferase-like isoleucine patch superfamily enzyme